MRIMKTIGGDDGFHPCDGGDRPRFSLGNVVREEMAGGLTAIVRENTRSSLISMEVIILAGSRQDTEETAGTASIAGNLLDSGAAGMTAEEISDRVEHLGGLLSTFGGYAASGISMTVDEGDFEEALGLAAQMLLRPDEHPDELEKRKRKVLADIISDRDNPRAMAFKRFYELVFEGHPRHRPVEGYEETVGRIGMDHVRRFRRQQYTAKNCLLVVSGNVRVNAVMDSIKQHFGGWESPVGKTPASEPPPQAVLSGKGIRVERLPMQKEQVNIFLGHPGIQRNDPDFTALRVMDKILGLGFTSRLNARLRDEMGLAYSTFGAITSTAGVDQGAFLCFIGTAPEKEVEAIEGILHEVRRIREEPVPEEELEAARRYLTGNYIFGLETNHDVNAYLVEAEITGLPLDHVDSFTERILRVTTDDLTEVANRHLDPENLVMVVAGGDEATGYSP